MVMIERETYENIYYRNIANLHSILVHDLLKCFILFDNRHEQHSQ